jgi:hypothetical protein
MDQQTQANHTLTLSRGAQMTVFILQKATES